MLAYSLVIWAATQAPVALVSALRETSVLFALLCGDVSAPVTFGVNRFGWAPTVQLTAYLRALPADGWLRVMCTATQIGQDWFDEDHVVVDCEGRIIVQTRQLAMVPALPS